MRTLIEREEEISHRKPRKTRKGEGEGVFSVLFGDNRGWEREEEINHRKHRKTRKEKGEGIFSVLFRDFRGSEILESANFVLGGSV